jgi:hypothetical protein
MSDSVGVFIPILKEAAESLKEKVDETRRKNHRFNKSLENGSTSDDKASDQSVSTGMDLVKEEEDVTETPLELKDHSTHNDDIAQKTASKTTHAVEKAIVSPSASSTTTNVSSKKDDNTLTVSNQRSVAVNKNSHAVKQSTSLRSKQNLEATSTSSSFLSKVTEFLPTSLQTCTSLLLLCFAMYMSIVWLKSGAKVVEEAHSFLNSNFSQPPQVFITNKSASRSVYLRDLDKGFLKNTIEPPYARAKR